MPLLWLSAAFLLGIALASVVSVPLPVWLAGGMLTFAGGLAEWRARRGRWSGPPVPCLLIAAALLLGGARCQSAVPRFTSADLAFYNGIGPVRLSGTLAAPPDRRDGSTLLRVRVERLVPEWGAARPVRGMALVRLSGTQDQLAYGERVTMAGWLEAPPEDESFSYRDYLARQGIYSYLEDPAVESRGMGPRSPLWAAVYGLRERGYRWILDTFSQPEAALMAGVLLGLERDFPPELEQAFRDTGTAHIVAISGANLSVVTALFLLLFGRLLPRGPAALASLAAVVFYTLLVGGQPPVVRAAVMGAAAMGGSLIGRRGSGLNSLGFCAALMCLFSPHLLRDASFQLSFSATLGLVLYGERLERRVTAWLQPRMGEGRAARLAAPLNEYLMLTLAAQITTLPVTLYHFQRLSLTTLIANPLVLPAQPLLMILGGLALLAGWVLPGLGALLGLPVWTLAAYTTRLVLLLGSIPSGAVSLGPVPGWLPWLLYALLFAFTLPGRARTPAGGVLRPAALVVVLLLGSGLGWRSMRAAPDGQLHLSVMALDGGPAVLARAPGGQVILLGGSASANALSGALGQRLPPVGAHLDAVVLFDGGEKALRGLPLTLERFPPEQVLWAVEPPQRASVDRLRAKLHQSGVPLERFHPAQEMLLDPAAGVRLVALTGAGGQAGWLLEWKSLRVLNPGGLPPGDLPENLRPGLLILNDGSLEKGSPEAWAALGAQVTAVASQGLDLPVDWVRLTPGQVLEVSSDGEVMRLSISR